MAISLEEWQDAAAYLYANARWDMDDAVSIMRRLKGMNDMETVAYLEGRYADIIAACRARQLLCAEHARIGRYNYVVQCKMQAFAGWERQPND